MRFLYLLGLAPLLAQDVDLPSRAAVATGSPSVVRLLIGVPGATVLSDPLSSGRSLVAPGHAWAVADTDEGVELIRLPGALSRAPIHGAPAGASAMAFSSNGNALVLYHPSAGVLLVSGLPDNAQTRAAGMPAGAESLVTVAVSGDALRAVASDITGNVFQWDGAWSKVSGVEGISALEMRGVDCLLASSAQQLLRLRPDGSLDVLAQLPLAPGAAMVSAPDLDRVLIVSSGGRDLMLVQLQTGIVNRIELDHPVTSVAAAVGGEFLLGSEMTTGVWSLDRNLKVSFLPAAHR